jgi:hypothetical protein
LGSGSGFVIGSDGRVATNYHVVHMPGTTQAEARFADGASYQVQGVLATDPDKDLAVLKLQATGKVFQAVHLGDSGQVQIGERVLAIGNPLAGVSPVSTEATVSDGIVSGIRDWPEHQMKVFQITAPISSGSSGGALVNANGEVIGVTFAQLVGGQNLNFAIPIGYLQSLSTDGPVKSLATINAAAPDDHVKGEESAPTGSYTGLWQSSKFSVSGAAQMTIRIAGDTARAEIFLTGGEVRSKVGAYANQRLNLAKLGRPMEEMPWFRTGPRKTGRPGLSGGPAKRSHGGIVNPPCNRKGKCGNPPPTLARAGSIPIKENTYPSCTYPTQSGSARVPWVGECADKLFAWPLLIRDKNRMRFQGTPTYAALGSMGTSS